MNTEILPKPRILNSMCWLELPELDFPSDRGTVTRVASTEEDVGTGRKRFHA